MKRDLLYVGITHKTAPLEVRELIRPNAEQQREMLSRMSLLAGGRLVLMTCERFELYAHKATIVSRSWMSTLASWFKVPPDMFASHAQALTADDAAVHLFRVAAGLDSRIVGEAQILGQLRSAFEQAAYCSAMDAELSALGRAAIRAGKRVRHETGASNRVRSIVAIACDHVTADSQPLEDKMHVVVGSGKLASEVVADLSVRGARRLSVCGRSLDRTTSMANRFGCEPVDFAHLARTIRAADAVIVCTSAPNYIVDSGTVEIRRTKPLRIVDLSVPRNVDPTLERIPGITVTHLDELLHGQAAQLETWDAAERIVQEELGFYSQWSREREVAPFIAALVRAADVSESRGEFVDRGALHRRIVRLKAGAA